MAVRRRVKRTRKREGQEHDRRLFAQLAICLVLFLLTFFGRSVLPDMVAKVFRTDTDFVAAFSGLGQSLAFGEPVGDSLGNFAVAVFGVTPMEETPAEENDPMLPEEPAVLPEMEPEELEPDYMAELVSQPEPIAPPEDTSQAIEEYTPVLPAEPEPVPVYTGKELPPKASMEKPALELSATVLPVYGVVSSDFGWRTDPFTGEDTFHYGTDIAVEAGTEIQAFAAGVVEYIGEAEDFGLYIKITHDNGVSSFYAHCSELLMQKGATVEAGQVIAKVGNTGRSTGAHLHVEIKQGETYLNPIYYLDLVE